jgi:hypothetical protein
VNRNDAARLPIRSEDLSGSPQTDQEMLAINGAVCV